MTSENPTQTLDVLAIGAHPDDVEIGVGGILLTVAAQGHSTAVLDLTRGEAGSRGSAEERAVEAQAAAQALGLQARENAQLPDGGLADTNEQREAVARAIRRLRPSIILSHAPHDRHPDHHAAHALVRNANFLAGVSTFKSEDEPHRAPRLFFYHPYSEVDTPPDLVVDISGQFDRKLEVLRAYRSQFHNPEYEGPATLVSSAEFWDAIRTRAAYWGDRIGVAYAEPLFADGPLAAATLPGLESIV